MTTHIIQPTTLSFITELQAQNNREWFQAHKPQYEAAHANMVAFAGSLHQELGDVDHIVEMSPKKILFRIYRDVRFAKDKSPYKNHWSGRFKRATESLRGGYYFHIAPGASFVAGGFFGPNSADLKRIRQEIDLDDKPLRRVLAQEKCRTLFGHLQGDKVRTTPQGYKKDHPAIDLLRHKQFILRREFNDASVLAPDFVETVADTFHGMQPFLNYMSEVLTTDTNGRSLFSAV